MVCRQCGTRNLPDEDFCRRCGANLKGLTAGAEPDEAAPVSTSEERAAEVRACLEKGDLKRAMDLAREAVVDEPEAAISHILLGDVYLRIQANDDALRAFRDAVVWTARTRRLARRRKWPASASWSRRPARRQPPTC